VGENHRDVNSDTRVYIHARTHTHIGMATYTNEDINNATKFADYNTKVRLLNAMYQRAPHLVSHLSIETRDATHDDFYVPIALSGIAKVIRIEFTKPLCDALSCNPSKETDMCKPTDKASYYYVGDSSFDVQCQPSCFNTAYKNTYNTDGSRAVDVPMLNWYRNECRIVNSNVITWLEKTFYRSDTKYERRLNDMPTGFSRTTTSNSDENQFGSGYTYTMNRAYCEYYDRSFDSENRTCKTELWETVLDAIVGMSLINNIRSSIRMLSNGERPFDYPSSLPKLPERVPDVYTLSGWRNNVNKDFVIPKLIDAQVESAKRRENISRTILVRRRKRLLRRRKLQQQQQQPLSQESINNNSIDQSVVRNRRSLAPTTTTTTNDPPEETTTTTTKIENSNIIVNNRRSAEISNIKNDIDKKKKQQQQQQTDQDDEEDNKPTSTLEHIRRIFISLLETVTEGEFWDKLFVDAAFNEILSKLKSVCVKVVEKLSTFLAKSGMKIGESVGAKVLSSSVRSMAVHVVSTTAIRLGAKFAVMMAKILSAAASVVGWILLVSTFLDIMFTFWDPYGYKNLFPPELPNDMMRNGELALRQAIGAVSVNYTFDNLAAILLSEDELLSIQIESLVDRVTYLNCLVVNSEGSRIDKGPLINTDDVSNDRVHDIQTSVIARRVRFDPDSFRQYNRKFNLRVILNKYLNYAAIASTTVAAILSVLTKFSVLSVLCFLVSLLILCVSVLCTQNDYLIDIIDNYVRSSFYTGNDNDI
jgi:hypothetical protein